MPSKGQTLQPFTGNGDVSIWVKNSRVGQLNSKQTKHIRCGTIKNSHCSKHMAMRDEHRSKFAALYQQWCFSIWLNISRVGEKTQTNKQTKIPVCERLAVELSLPVLRLRSVAAGIRSPNLLHATESLSPTAPPRRLNRFKIAMKMKYINIHSLNVLKEPS